MPLVTSVLSDRQEYGLAEPLTGLNALNAPANELFLWFSSQVEPTQYTTYVPFGNPQQIPRSDGGRAHLALPFLSWKWDALGITHLSTGINPDVSGQPAGQEYLLRPTIQGLIQLVERCIYLHGGNIWINYRQLAFTTNPAAIDREDKWFKAIATVQLVKWQADSSDNSQGRVMTGLMLNFAGLGLPSRVLDPDSDYTGGEPDPPADDTDNLDPYSGGLGVGRLGRGGLGIGSSLI